MQEKETIIVLRCVLKIPSLGITVRHHLASFVMPKSYLRDGIFNPHLTTIKDSYNLSRITIKSLLGTNCIQNNKDSCYPKTEH